MGLGKANEMRCLSVRQPWAWAIIHAGKTIENRGWSPTYRGPLAIHASKGMTNAEYDRFVEFYAKIIRGSLFEAPIKSPMPSIPPKSSLERGGFIGVVDLVDCVYGRSDSPWFFGPVGLVLANPRPIPFVPHNGALGLFKPPARLLRIVTAAPSSDRGYYEVAV